MNNAIDKNISKFHKGFLTTTQGGYEDPTYIGFKLKFDFNPTHRNMETGETDSPLFSEKDELESAMRYLKSNGYPNRAKMLKEFKNTLEFVNTSSPWYWQTLSGMENIVKLEFGQNFNPFRAKDKFIEIACLESIDLRITALADLYKKAVFDSKFMRKLLPDNLTYFKMTVELAEIRNFTKVSDLLKINTAVSNLNPNTSDQRALEQAAGFTGNGSEVEAIEKLISVLSYTFHQCQFDFWESFVSDREIVMNGNLEPAKQKFKIKVGRIEEAHTFTLMDLVLRDGVNQETRDFKYPIPDQDKAFNNRPDNILTNSIKGVTSQIQDRLNQITNLPGQLVSRGLNTVQSNIDKQILGNVYSLRNQDITTIINGFVGGKDQIKPLSKENALIDTPRPPENLAPNDVYPTVPGSGNGTATTSNIGNPLLNMPPEPNPLGNEDIYPDVPGRDLESNTSSNLGNISS